jgi:hypothetical protein
MKLTIEVAQSLSAEAKKSKWTKAQLKADLKILDAIANKQVFREHLKTNLTDARRFGNSRPMTHKVNIRGANDEIKELKAKLVTGLTRVKIMNLLKD